MMRAETSAWQGAETIEVDIQRRLPHFALDIAFRVPAGRTVLFGPSGAGKSLTLQAIAGLFPLERARISSCGATWHDSSTGLFVPPQRRRVGYLPQSYALFPHLTVAQNIAFGQRRRGMAARKRVAELILLMQLEGLERFHPAQLSGGQQQRVALARALASEPQLLLLDEPWSALDGPVRATLRAEILRFYEQVQVPFVLVTHDMQDAQTLADAIVVIDRGCVLQVGSPQDVFRAPRTTRVAELVGMNARRPGTLAALGSVVEDKRLATLEIASLMLHAWVSPASRLCVGQTVEIGFNTDEISLCLLAEDHQECSSQQTDGLVAGTVVREQVSGSFSNVTMQIAPDWQLDIPVPRWQHRALGLAAGISLKLRVPCEALHIFEPEEQSAEITGPTLPGSQTAKQLPHIKYKQPNVG